MRQEAPTPAPAVSKDAPRVDRDGGAVALRLAIGRDGLGLELARPATLECLDVVELVVRLPHVRFPFDVTGGVAKFRHRRGELERLAIEVDVRRAARWAEPRLRGLLAAGTCSVAIEARAFGARVSVLARDASEEARTRDGGARLAALAFEIALVPVGEDLVLAVHGARGAGLAEAATTLAIRALAALVGDGARREGARFVIERAAEHLARRLLPDAGVRAPGGEAMKLAGSGASDGALFALFTRRTEPAEIPAEITRAFEATALCREGDDARVAGDPERARGLDLAALERAPRHPELACRIAELDARSGGRAEAAIVTLREAAWPARQGTLLGELLAEAGDVPAAIAALQREAEAEGSSFVAALALARAAVLHADPHEALLCLDGAIARAPRLAELRWARAQRRLAAGRLADARADFQELEALADGARARFAVLRRAGDAHKGAGLGADAAAFYERALLYRPDDPETLAGLGVALADEGRAARGAALVAHAIALAEERRVPTSWMELALARMLAGRLADRPAAIARLRAVPDEAPEAIEARGLEGRLRAALGDAAGATLAFARLRERATAASAVPWLVEAARFESARGELAGAQRHLAVAIALTPANADLLAEYRAANEALARAAGARSATINVEGTAPTPPAPAPLAPAAPPPAPAIPPARDSARTFSLDVEPDVDSSELEAEAEARVEQLTRAIQADPTNDAAVDELVILLQRLGRSMELLALLSARLEDAPPERRDALLPRHREVLAKLESDARTEGRDAEADLFKMAREMS